MVKRPDGKTTSEKVAQYETLNPLLISMYNEFQEFSKKKQDGQVGKAKVKMVNRLLVEVHKIVKDEPNMAFLDLLDEDDLPQNSDVVLILGQTKAAMSAFHAKYHFWNGGEYTWSVW